ncbi:hypothetical protein EJD97_006346, partial [Solanum chilense]
RRASLFLVVDRRLSLSRRRSSTASLPPLSFSLSVDPLALLSLSTLAISVDPRSLSTFSLRRQVSRHQLASRRQPPSRRQLQRLSSSTAPPSPGKFIYLWLLKLNVY